MNKNNKFIRIMVILILIGMILPMFLSFFS